MNYPRDPSVLNNKIDRYLWVIMLPYIEYGIMYRISQHKKYGLGMLYLFMKYLYD